jgi:hypothetical protein
LAPAAGVGNLNRLGDIPAIDFQMKGPTPFAGGHGNLQRVGAGLLDGDGVNEPLAFLGPAYVRGMTEN